MLHRSVLVTFVAGVLAASACDRAPEPEKVEPPRTDPVPSPEPGAPEISVQPSRGSEPPRVPADAPKAPEAVTPVERVETPAPVAPTTAPPVEADTPIPASDKPKAAPTPGPNVAPKSGPKKAPEASASPSGRPVAAFSECKSSETFADGRCYASFKAACRALGCKGSCTQLRSRPPQARCKG